jgi:hypothetical protein
MPYMVIVLSFSCMIYSASERLIQFIRPSLQIETVKLISFPQARKWPNRYQRILVVGDITQIYAFEQELHSVICITRMW